MVREGTRALLEVEGDPQVVAEQEMVNLTYFDVHLDKRETPIRNGGLSSSRWVVVSADAGRFLPFHLGDQSLDVEHLVLARCPDQSQTGDQGEEADPCKQS